jgi:outer membrane protein OmpA-like peptidoglycan-associated protein
MTRARSILLLCLATLLLVPAATLAATPQAKAADAAGCKDHPLFTRMQGMRIVSCKSADFDRMIFKTGKATQEPVEGRRSEVRYTMGDPKANAPSPLAIIRNHQQAISAIGGTVVYEDQRYTTLKVSKDGKEIWTQVDTAWGRGYFLTIVEKQAMAQQVVASADLFKSGLAATGHVEVPGIYFDTGKADLKAESDAAVAEVAKLLKADPALKVFVVGHTDNVASLDLNTKLSQARAEAVVQALVTKHGITGARLVGRGVGPLAPVASNEAEEGRARNRRVELVKQ